MGDLAREFPSLEKFLGRRDDLRRPKTVMVLLMDPGRLREGVVRECLESNAWAQSAKTLANTLQAYLGECFFLCVSMNV